VPPGGLPRPPLGRLEHAGGLHAEERGHGAPGLPEDRHPEVGDPGAGLLDRHLRRGGQGILKPRVPAVDGIPDGEDAGKALAAAEQERAEASQALSAARDEARAHKIKAKEEVREVMATLRQRLRDLSRMATLDRTAIKETGREVESLARRLDPDDVAHPTVFSDAGKGIHVGDRVKISRLNKTGTVLLSSRGMLELDVDGKKLKLSIGEVALMEPVSQKQETGAAQGWGAELHEIEGLPDRLNIIGLRVPEALEEVDRFLDRATLSGFSSATIIHGIGTGALKTAVTELLKGHPLVSALRPGKPEEGGPGVTVAELKK